MTLAIVVLSKEEEFLGFLDPDLCNMTETHSEGLRTLLLNYKFQDLHTDKQLFKIGNKVWVSGDKNLDDCLYVINTPVETDVYKDNSFTMTIEEVLTELNYAPLFSQNQIKEENGFKITTTVGQRAVTINWNFLNYFFGDYYNIGVVQKCLNEDYNKVALSGTMTLMGLLRYIEEETGNVFVTRYEKDQKTNVIHRYLDFLNPIDVSKDWELNIEYDFVQGVEDTGVFDEDGNPSSDEDEYADTETVDDLVNFDTDYTPLSNVDPTVCEFRITDEDLNLLNNDGLIYTGGGSETPLRWTNADIRFDGTENNVVIKLSSVKNVVGLVCNNKSFVVNATEQCGTNYGRGFVAIADENTPTTRGTSTIPDDSYFTIYDTYNQETIFKTCINREIGHVHEEILDFSFNVENMTFETDETDTFTAIAPVITLDDNSSNTSLTRANLGTLIRNWESLSIAKGDKLPMIVQKITIQNPTLEGAKRSLGSYVQNSGANVSNNISNNYWRRPLKPQDNIDSNDSSNNSWEFWRGTAYWKAPFSKNPDELHVNVDNVGSTEYTEIYSRPDTRESREIIRPKIGTAETSEEDVYAIYNAVAMKLKDKMYPQFKIGVDVANLRQKSFNQYQLHDKVYVKLPDYGEIVTARVTKTTKESHNVAKNTIELDNFRTNIIKNIPNNTYLEASNVSFQYPNSKDLTVRLINEDYNSSNEYSVQYPANKLITFVLYKVDNASTTLTKTTYSKLTNANGYATVNLKYDPGDYELDIHFGGDEEYSESSVTVKINVSGTKEVASAVVTKNKKPSDLSSSKTTAKTTSSTKRYYSKYGVSPDNKYLMAIGRPSAGGELGKYGYKFYKVVFYRKCPFCGSKELYWNIFWAGNEKGSWGTNPAVGRRKSGSAEGEITCKKCDADFSIFGKDKATTPRKTLKVYKSPVASSKTEAYTLKKGKMYYDTVTISNTSKAVTDTKTRTTGGYTIPASVKKQALAIVGNSTGLDAAKKIAAWCGSKAHLKYSYYANFHRTPATALSKHSANCCDSTRLMLTMMYAVGCNDKLKLQYVHCSTGSTGHIFAKVTTRSTNKWRYVDPCCKLENGRNPWGSHLKGYGPVVHIYDYTGPNNSPF